MKKKLSSILFVIIVITLLIPQQTTAATTTNYDYTIYQITTEYTTDPHIVINSDGGTAEYIVSMENHGTGFFVPGNYMVTAAHVLETNIGEYADRVDMKLTYRKNKKTYKETLSLNVAYIDGANDIAIIYGNEKTQKYCKPIFIDFDKEFDKEESLTMYGYPLDFDGELDIESGKYFASQDLMVNHFSGDPWLHKDLALINSGTYSGMSGGPVIDTNGKVVGIIANGGEYWNGRFTGIVKPEYIRKAFFNLEVQGSRGEAA